MTQQHLNYPAKTCEIDRLVTHDRLVDAALKGSKTQQRRNGVYGYPGERFDLNQETFVITALERQSLGNMTEQDAQAEGFPNLEMYKQLIISMHGGMDWNDTHQVWVHSFKKQSA
ncbi:ASCH domain-containing protein [Methylophaga sp.]|uniref:ASCH domain-containing protein n=1 Tax=Methylophaga sp. TaxID=2024840 RepID=UPI003F69AE30